MPFVKLLSQSKTARDNIISFEIFDDSHKLIYSGVLNFPRSASRNNIKETIAAFADDYIANSASAGESIDPDISEIFPLSSLKKQITDEEQKQVEIGLYGQSLTGDETELELVKLQRIKQLKDLMRIFLAGAIGDNGDNIADAVRALVLGEAIRAGMVTDQAIIAGYQTYIGSLLQGYGGAAAILEVLESDLSALATWMVGKFYVAKASVLSQTTIDGVNAVNLP